MTNSEQFGSDRSIMRVLSRYLTGAMRKMKVRDRHDIWCRSRFSNHEPRKYQSSAYRTSSCLMTVGVGVSWMTALVSGLTYDPRVRSTLAVLFSWLTPQNRGYYQNMLRSATHKWVYNLLRIRQFPLDYYYYYYYYYYSTSSYRNVLIGMPVYVFVTCTER